MGSEGYLLIGAVQRITLLRWAVKSPRSSSNGTESAVKENDQGKGRYACDNDSLSQDFDTLLTTRTFDRDTRILGHRE
jgi:hypothetical protein